MSKEVNIKIIMLVMVSFILGYGMHAWLYRDSGPAYLAALIKADQEKARKFLEE